MRSEGRHRPEIAKKRRSDDKDSDSDSDIDIDEDSGYASNTNIEAEYLNGLVEKFREMGLQISNLNPRLYQLVLSLVA